MIPIPREYDKVLKLKVADDYMTPKMYETHNYPFIKNRKLY